LPVPGPPQPVGGQVRDLVEVGFGETLLRLAAARAARQERQRVGLDAAGVQRHHAVEGQQDVADQFVACQ